MSGSLWKDKDYGPLIQTYMKIFSGCDPCKSAVKKVARGTRKVRVDEDGTVWRTSTGKEVKLPSSQFFQNLQLPPQAVASLTVAFSEEGNSKELQPLKVMAGQFAVFMCAPGRPAPRGGADSTLDCLIQMQTQEAERGVRLNAKDGVAIAHQRCPSWRQWLMTADPSPPLATQGDLSVGEQVQVLMAAMFQPPKTQKESMQEEPMDEWFAKLSLAQQTVQKKSQSEEGTTQPAGSRSGSTV